MAVAYVGFPRLYAAASLKLFDLRADVPPLVRFPRLYAAASLKPDTTVLGESGQPQFSAALCRGLIEAKRQRRRWRLREGRFPRLYAAASLKRKYKGTAKIKTAPFSAALCRGLIEAATALAPAV